jgi:hypothetical protein
MVLGFFLKKKLFPLFVCQKEDISIIYNYFDFFSSKKSINYFIVLIKKLYLILKKVLFAMYLMLICLFDYYFLYF